MGKLIDFSKKYHDKKLNEYQLKLQDVYKKLLANFQEPLNNDSRAVARVVEGILDSGLFWLSMAKLEYNHNDEGGTTLTYALDPKSIYVEGFGVETIMSLTMTKCDIYPKDAVPSETLGAFAHSVAVEKGAPFNVFLPVGAVLRYIHDFEDFVMPLDTLPMTGDTREFTMYGGGYKFQCVVNTKTIEDIIKKIMEIYREE